MTRILVVDDDPLSARMMESALRMGGFDVVLAPNGATAVALLDAEAAPVHLVITDIFMPEMDGLELIRTIRARRPTIPVIAVSAGSSRCWIDFLPIARSLGADEILPKPLSPPLLLASVERVLERLPACASAPGADG